MARDKESMQDIAMYHMDKLNRQNTSVNKIKTLAEQLAEFNKSPEQLRRESSYYDWSKDLKEACDSDKFGPSGPYFLFVTARYKKEMEEFHSKGTPFKEIIFFIKSKEEEYINR